MDKSMLKKLAHMKKEYSKKKRKLKKFHRAEQARKHVKLKLEELNTKPIREGDDNSTIDMTGQSLQSSLVEDIVSAELKHIVNGNADKLKPTCIELARSGCGADTEVATNIKDVHKSSHGFASKGTSGSRWFERTTEILDDSEDLFLSQYGINSETIVGVQDAHHLKRSMQHKSRSVSDQNSLTEKCSTSQPNGHGKSQLSLRNETKECNIEQEQAEIVNSDVEERTIVQQNVTRHEHGLRNYHGKTYDENSVRKAFQDINISVEPDRNTSVGEKNSKFKSCDSFLQSNGSSQSSSSLFSQDSLADDYKNLENTNIRRRSRSRKRKSFGTERRRSSPRIAELSTQESISESSEYNQRVFPSNTDLATKQNSLIVSSLFQCLVDEVKRDKTVVEFGIPDYIATKGTNENINEICDSHISDITPAKLTDKCQEVCQCETVMEACLYHEDTADSIRKDQHKYTDMSDVVQEIVSGNSKSESNGLGKEGGPEHKLEIDSNTSSILKGKTLPDSLQSVSVDRERNPDIQLPNVIEISDSPNQSINSIDAEEMSPSLFESPDSHICSKFDFPVKQDMSPGCCVNMVGMVQAGEDGDKQGQGKLLTDRADSSTEAIQPARNSEEEDDGMVLQQIGTFQVVGDQLLCMVSTELLVDQERRQFVVCLCTGSLKVYTHNAGHWTCVCTHKLANSVCHRKVGITVWANSKGSGMPVHAHSLTRTFAACFHNQQVSVKLQPKSKIADVRKSSSYGMVLLEDTDGVNVVVQQLRTDTTSLTMYTYTDGHMDTHIIDTIWARSVHVCPLRGYQLMTSLYVDSRTYLNKYTMHNGHWTQQTVDSIPDQISCMVPVRGIDAAIVGLSKQGTVYVWNHEQGCLLCSVDITDVCAGDMVCPMVCSEQGFLFVPVFPRKRSRDRGSVIVVNPQLGTCETLVSLPLPDGTWSGYTQASMISDSLLVVRESCGRIHIWDVYLGTLLATLGHVTVTSHSVANHSIAVAHKHCVHVYNIKT